MPSLLIQEVIINDETGEKSKDGDKEEGDEDSDSLEEEDVILGEIKRNRKEIIDRYLKLTGFSSLVQKGKLSPELKYHLVNIMYVILNFFLYLKKIKMKSYLFSN